MFTGNNSVLSAMCELFRAAHRGRLEGQKALDELERLELQFDPDHAYAKRSFIKKPMPSLPIAADASARSSWVRDYQKRKSQAQQFMADIIRLGTTQEKLSDDRNPDNAGNDSADGAGGVLAGAACVGDEQPV